MTKANISVVETKVFKTSDGTTFDDRNKALEHERYLNRTANVQKLLSSDKGDWTAFYTPDDERDNLVIGKDDLAGFIASLGDDLLQAMTVKEARGRGALKAAA